MYIYAHIPHVCTDPNTHTHKHTQTYTCFRLRFKTRKAVNNTIKRFGKFDCKDRSYSFEYKRYVKYRR